MKKLIHDNKIIIILLMLFIILQPFLDMKILFEDKNLMIKGITIPTIIRTLFISIIGCILFIRSNNKKEKIGIIIYFLLVVIYTIIHHLVCKRSIDIPSNFTYSFITESFYIIRMLLPLALIYITKHSKISKDSFFDVILYSSMIIGIVIVVSNTFLLLYTSYESEIFTVRASWIDWIFGNISQYKFEELTSKGWFYLANQVAGLSMLLLPFCIYALLKKVRISNLIATISLTFSMIILGTRTSAYGFILVYILLLVSNVLLYKLKFIKEINIKSMVVAIVIFVGFILLLLIAPIRFREQASNRKPAVLPPELTENYDVYDYIKEYYSYYEINEKYIENYYPYTYDYILWLDIFDKSKERILDNRDIELLISNRIMSKNNDLSHELFGYSFSRMRNGYIYIEKDFLVQKFTVGTIGTFILIAPYFIYMISLVVKRIKKKRISLSLITFIVSMCAVFGSSIFTGHILDELFVMLYVGFIIGFYLINGGKKYES